MLPRNAIPSHSTSCVSHPAFRVHRCSTRQTSPLGVGDSARGIEMPGRRVISPRWTSAVAARAAAGNVGWHLCSRFPGVPGPAPVGVDWGGAGTFLIEQEQVRAPQSRAHSWTLRTWILMVLTSTGQNVVERFFLLFFVLFNCGLHLVLFLSWFQVHSTIRHFTRCPPHPHPDISSPRPAPHTLLQYHRLHALCCAYIPVTTLSLPTCASRSLHFFTQLPSLPPGPYL